MKKRTITCICCPLGCTIKLTEKNGKITLTGEQCKQGKTYAIQEITDPQRILTTTIKIQGGTRHMLPVRSKKELPKHKIKKCIKHLSTLTVKAPIYCGDIICQNILDTNVDIIASRNMEKETP